MNPCPTLPVLPTTLPDDPREAFFALATFLRTDLDLGTLNTAWMAYVTSKLQVLWKAAHPRSKYNEIKALDEFRPFYTDLFDTEAKPLADAIFALRKEVEAKLDEVAQLVEIRKTDEWVEYLRVDFGSYRSMDSGSGFYAKGSAGSTVMELEQAGFEAKMEVESRTIPSTTAHGRSFTLSDAVVFVKVHPDDIPILKRKDIGMTLVEWVASCWKRQLNPRCYNPWLEPGFEARHGIKPNGDIVPVDM